MRPLLTFLLAFVQTLQRLVNAHSKELDHRILHAQAAFKFLHDFRAGAELHQHILPFPLLFHFVSEAAFAPLFDFVDGALRIGHVL